MKLHPLSSALLLASVAGAAPAAPAAAPDSPLATLQKANSVQVTETISVASSAGPLQPGAILAVTLSRPGMARMEQSHPGAKTPDMIMVSDGKTMTEFDLASNQYRKSDAPPRGFGPAGIPALGDYPAAAVSTATTLNGKPALLYKATRQVQGKPLTQKLWVDPQTHLPERQSTVLGAGAAAKEMQRVVFTDWSLDKTLAPTLFAFTPPAGATEFKPPAAAQAAPELLAKGTAAPDFTAIDKDGKSVKLSDYKGKVVVIDFWASWCPPCRASMPHNQEVAKKFQDAGTPFVLLAVDNSEERDAFSTWVAKNGPALSALTFVHIPRATKVAGALYHVSGIPTQYVIDPKGNVVQSFVGYGGPSDDLSDAVKAAAAL